MDRRTFFTRAAVLATVPLLGGKAAASALSSPAMQADPDHFDPLEKPESWWRDVLNDDQFRILRKDATERAGTSPLNDEKRKGTYICAGCFLPLFESSRKYESGTGWPSFWEPIHGHAGTKLDFKLILPRTEYHCARCEGHQGHVFDDGPEPTGKRWCNNGVALHFVPEGRPLPELRS